MTSHAAVVARGWGKPCVSGCAELSVNDASATATLGGATLQQGDWLSLNGTTGEVILGRAPLKVCGLTGAGRVCGVAVLLAVREPKGRGWTARRARSSSAGRRSWGRLPACSGLRLRFGIPLMHALYWR